MNGGKSRRRKRKRSSVGMLAREADFDEENRLSREEARIRFIEDDKRRERENAISGPPQRVPDQEDPFDRIDRVSLLSDGTDVGIERADEEIEPEESDSDDSDDGDEEQAEPVILVTPDALDAIFE